MRIGRKGREKTRQLGEGGGERKGEKTSLRLATLAKTFEEKERKG